VKVADEMRKALQKKLSRQIYLLHDLDVVIKKISIHSAYL